MPEYVKIDRMLLTGIDADPHRQHFVKAIIEFTSTNDIKALAEGVEVTSSKSSTVTPFKSVCHSSPTRKAAGSSPVWRTKTALGIPRAVFLFFYNPIASASFCCASFLFLSNVWL